MRDDFGFGPRHGGFGPHHHGRWHNGGRWHHGPDRLAEAALVTAAYNRDPKAFGSAVKSYMVFSLIAFIIFVVVFIVIALKFGKSSKNE